MTDAGAGFDRERNCIVEQPGSNIEHISGIAVLDNHGVNLVSSAVTALIAPYVALGIWRHFVWLSAYVRHTCMSTCSMFICNTCQRNGTVERRLDVSFCSEPCCCHRHYSLTARFWPKSLYTVLQFHFRTDQVPCLANLCECGRQRTMDRLLDAHPLTEFEGGIQSVCKVHAELTEDYIHWLQHSIHKMKWT